MGKEWWGRNICWVGGMLEGERSVLGEIEKEAERRLGGRLVAGLER